MTPAFEIRRRSSKQRQGFPLMCSWFECAPDAPKRRGSKRRTATAEVLILDRDAGGVCTRHTTALVELFDGALDRPPVELEAVA